MDLIRRWRPLVGLSAAAILLAGCASSSGTAQGPAPPITSLASYRTLSLPKDTVRLALAMHVARGLLSAAKLPPGGVASGASTVTLSRGDPNDVAISRVYAVEKLPRHPRSEFLPAGAAATIGGGSPTSSEVGFTFPNVTWPNSKTLLYTMQRDAYGDSVRIEAQVTWASAKPLIDYVAPGASRVTVTYRHFSHVTRAVVTTSSTVERITSIVNAMPAAPVGVVGGCLEAGGTSTVTVSFWHSTSTHPYESIVMDPDCFGAAITHYGSNGAVTAKGEGSGGVSKVIVRLAGIMNGPPV